MKKYIEFLPEHQQIPFDKEESVLEVALKNKISIDHSCGGNGTCTTCLVEVINPLKLPQKNEVELEITEGRGFKDNERLACQLKPLDKMIIKTRTNYLDSEK